MRLVTMDTYCWIMGDDTYCWSRGGDTYCWSRKGVWGLNFRHDPSVNVPCKIVDLDQLDAVWDADCCVMEGHMMAVHCIRSECELDVWSIYSLLPISLSQFLLRSDWPRFSGCSWHTHQLLAAHHILHPSPCLELDLSCQTLQPAVCDTIDLSHIPNPLSGFLKANNSHSLLMQWASEKVNLRLHLGFLSSWAKNDRSTDETYWRLIFSAFWDTWPLRTRPRSQGSAVW